MAQFISVFSEHAFEDISLMNIVKQGIEVPEVLRKYIPGQPEFLPYTKELPKGSTSQKAKGKADGPKAQVPAPGDVADKVKDMKVSS